MLGGALVVMLGSLYRVEKLSNGLIASGNDPSLCERVEVEFVKGKKLFLLVPKYCAMTFASLNNPSRPARDMESQSLAQPPLCD